MAARKTYRFTFILGGIPEIPAAVPYDEFVECECGLMDEMAGRLLAAGCDDATLGARGSTYFLDFDRESERLSDAIGSAIEDVEEAGLEVAQIQIEQPERAG